VVRARVLVDPPPSDHGALYPGFGETRGEERRARTIFENGFRIWRFHVRSWTPVARRRHTRDFSFMHTRCWQKTDCAVRPLGPPSISACAYRNVYARDRITHGAAAPCTRFFLGVGSTPTINDRICLCDCLRDNQNGNHNRQRLLSDRDNRRRNHQSLVIPALWYTIICDLHAGPVAESFCSDEQEAI